MSPVGYWVPRAPNSIETFTLSSGEPVHRKEYIVRRGTVWDFRISRAANAEPVHGVVFASDQAGIFRSSVDDAGRVRLTLPSEAGKVTAAASEKPLPFGVVLVTVEWETGFRPDAVKSVSNLGGSPVSHRLTDNDGKTATLSGTEKGRAQPVLENGQLVVRVTLPEPDPKAFGELTGKVVDTAGQPIAGAHVALIWVEENGGSGMSSDDRHRAVTDADGNYRFTAIPRTHPAGKPPQLQFAVTKEGFAGVDTKPFTFRPQAPDTPQGAEPVALGPGCSLSGIVVDPDGKPLAGVWIQPGGSYASRSQFTKTDDAGRFTVRDLPNGIVPLNFHYGKLYAGGKYLADRGSDPVTVKLRPVPDSAQLKAQSEAAKTNRPNKLAPGTPAPEWESGAWSDGRSRTLGDYRGKVVFLNFWGIWCGPCVHELPTLEKLRVKYEPPGVVFLSLHTPGETEKTVRKLLEMKKASLVFAFDVDRKKDDNNLGGVTAERYGVGCYPTTMIIDREGKIAFSTNDPSNLPAMQQTVKEMGFDPKTINEEQVSRFIERLLDQAIDRVLNPRTR